MGINKKGIFFTALVITIATLFLLSYSFYSVITERQSIQKRIETMNNFLFSIEEDIPRQLYISGFRVIFLLEKRILESGDYIPDIDAAFQEAFYNGTILGTNNNDSTLLMQDAKFTDIVANIQSKGDKLNVNISMTSPIVNISQIDPWNILVSLTTEFSMRDKSGLASWNKTWTINSFIPIEEFEDPIYTKESGGSANNKITRTPHSLPFTPATLNDHAIEGYYLNNTDAPSFLDRMEGNLTAQSPYGIESLAVPPFPESGDSIVDHEYFIGTPGIHPGCSAQSYLIFDLDHINLYRPC